MMGFQIYRIINTGLSESDYGYRLTLKEEGIWSNENNNEICIRACLKIHSRHMHAPLCGRFGSHSVNVAHYASLIRVKSPTNCDAHLTESNFQTRSRLCGCYFYHNCCVLGEPCLCVKLQNNRGGHICFTGWNL